MGPLAEKSSLRCSADCRLEERAKVGPLKVFAQQEEADPEQRSIANVVELWDEQKWVQQIRSARLAPDAEWQDLA